MAWINVASIIFICVTANHLGLIKAIRDVSEIEIPIVDCPKCFTFWSVLVYMVFSTHSIIVPLATSFLASYIAIWLELLEGYVDTLYLKAYDKIYSNTKDGTIATSASKSNSTGSVP